MSNKDKILKISKELGLSHIGSNLSALPILEEIYAKKNPEDIVILDNAHSHLAHLVVKNTWFNKNKDFEENIKIWGIHCDRQSGCDASGGSLGHGLGIAIGYALAGHKVHVIVSDGSMHEGSNWEALRLIRDLGIKNIQIYVNANGYTALQDLGYAKVLDLKQRMEHLITEPEIKFIFTANTKGFEGVAGHYKTI